MPHVASQICSSELFLESPSRRKAVATSKKSVELQRPVTGLPRRRRKTCNADDARNLSLLVDTPDMNHWDFGSIRHIREPSSASAITPDSAQSAVESVFDLYSASPVGSPNSSIYPSFVAELEDTSPIAKPKRSRHVVEDPYVAPLSLLKKSSDVARNSYFQQLTRPEFSMRAAVAIENITAIETDNRLLLERAIAAEEAAKLLREKNQSLQDRIDYCVNLHRPKTAPGKAPRAASTGNLMSSFNETYRTSLQRLPQTPPLLHAPQIPSPSSRRRPTPLKLSAPHLAPSPAQDQMSNPFSAIGIRNMPQTTPQTPTPSSKQRPSPFSQPLLSPSSFPHDIAPSPFATIAFPANPHSFPRTRPPPIRTSHSYTNIAEIGSPIPGSVNKHTVTYEGVPISDRPPVQTISLAEAQRREKPLPPNGPMSPSALPGRVEIGGGYEDYIYGKEEETRREEAKSRRGLRMFFRWSKKDQSQIS